MKNRFLGISAAAFICAGGFAGAQTIVESATQPDPGTKMRLAAMDTSAAAFRKMDEDKDGRISALEAANNPRVAAAFTMADRDKDGYLSKEEFEAMNPASTASHEVDASTPSGDRATMPAAGHATMPTGDLATMPTGDHASDPSGDQPATGPDEPTPNDNSTSPRRVAHPRR
jgi:EF hand